MQTTAASYRTLRLAAYAALGVLLAACGGPKSSSTGGEDGGAVPTNEITIFMTVETTDQGPVVVRANLNDGKVFGESYRLDGGDFLRACLGRVCRPMADNDSLFTPDYIARFDYVAGVDYVVSFNRQDAKNAPDSRVMLPPPFSLVTPADRQPVTDGDSVPVSWSPSGAPARVTLRYSGDCKMASGATLVIGGTLDDDTNGDGRETVRIDPIITFARTNQTSAITSCHIDIIVSHELQGRFDPAFHKGTVVGRVSRTARLDYTPR